jgi:hypothetical protein
MLGILMICFGIRAAIQSFTKEFADPDPEGSVMLMTREPIMATSAHENWGYVLLLRSC